MGFEKEKKQRLQVVKLPENQAFLLNAFRVAYAFSLDEKIKSNQLKTLISIDIINRLLTHGRVFKILLKFD